MQHSHSEGVGSSRDLGEAAHKTAPGKAAHWGGLMGRDGSGWTQGEWGTLGGRVQWVGWRLRMCENPAGAVQGLQAAPAGGFFLLNGNAMGSAGRAATGKDA